MRIELRDDSADREYVGENVDSVEYVIDGVAVFVMVDDTDLVTVPVTEALFVFVALVVTVFVILAVDVGVRDSRDEPVIVIVFLTVPDTVAVPRTETVILVLGVLEATDVDVLLEDTDAVIVDVRFTVPVITGLPDTVFVDCELRDPEALAVGVLLDFVVTVVVPEAVVVLEDVTVLVVVTVGLIVFVIGEEADTDGEADCVLDGAVERVIDGEADCVLETGADRVCVGDVEEVFELDIDDVAVFDEVVVLVAVDELVVVRLCTIESEARGEDDDVLLNVALLVDVGDRPGVSVIREVGVSKFEGRVLLVAAVERVDVLLEVGLSVGSIPPMSKRRRDPESATSISIRASFSHAPISCTPYS